jgi:hypothetical protein
LRRMQRTEGHLRHLLLGLWDPAVQGDPPLANIYRVEQQEQAAFWTQVDTSKEEWGADFEKPMRT